MNQIIDEVVKLGLWRQFDVHFAYMLVKSHQYSLILAILTLNFYIHRGHVCLPLVMLTPKKLFCGLHIVLATKVCEEFGNLSLNKWKNLLSNSSIVGDGLSLTPLVLYKDKLYLYHMWKSERLIAKFFYESSLISFNFSENKIKQIIKFLNQIFPITNNYNDINGYYHSKNDEKFINWQKVAIVMALTRKMVLISGSPGTGKTTIVAKLLIILSLLYPHSSLMIKIAAPTGKSADRLNQSIYSTIKKLYLLHGVGYKENNLSIRAVTLHRLFSLSPFSNKKSTKFSQYDLLFLDYLIIDECSMIDLFMMSKIIEYLPSHSKIIFLGDHQQLPPVESGAIFADICYFINKGYTVTFCDQLKKLTNYVLPINKKDQYSIFNSLCLLDKNYRFSVVSGIGKLADAIRIGNKCSVLSILTSHNNNDLSYIIVKNYKDYFNMLINCALGYVNYFKNIIYNHDYCKNLECILNIFNQYRILCVLRDGPFGVLALNSFIEKILSSRGFINLEDNNQNYIGRPIIITANEPSLSLFNGEIGIILPDNGSDFSNSKLCAYFLSLDKKYIKKISLYNLPKYESSFVMTVHKSQGSEFNFVTLIFPDEILPILTNELFYTGVTRACKKLLIYAHDQTIIYAVSNICERYSGLVDRLKELMH